MAALSSTGLVARIGAGAAAARTLTAPPAGITVSNGNGVSGNPTLALANDLAALEALDTNNSFPVRTGTDSWVAQPYVTGTYVPTVKFSTPGSSSFSYTLQAAAYVKIGNLVYVDIVLTFTPTVGSGAGDFQVTLPFAAAASTEDVEGSISFISSAFTWGTGRTMLTLTLDSTTTLAISASGSGVTSANFGTSNLTNSVSHALNLHFIYRI